MDNEEKRKKWREQQSRFRLRHPDYYSKWRKENKDEWNAYKRKWYRHERLKVLIHYSSGQPKCACCGESKIEFLCIDHICRGGTRHRSQIGNGNCFYAWLKKNNFPLGYRVLCHNCNSALGYYGYCPHQVKDQKGK